MATATVTLKKLIPNFVKLATKTSPELDIEKTLNQINNYKNW